MTSEDVRTRSLAALEKVAGALRWRYLGLGFVWAWLYCSYATPALFEHRAGPSSNADGSWLVSAATVVLVFLIGGALLSRRRSATLTPLHVIAPGLLAVGTVVSALGGSIGVVSAWAGGILTGTGYALTSILWAQALARLGVEELEVVVPVSSVVIVPCVIVFPSLQGALGVAVTAALPVVSGILLCLCVGEGMRLSATGMAAEPAGNGPGEGAADAADGEGAAQGGCGGLPPESVAGYLVRTGIVLCVLYAAVGFGSALAEARDSVHALVGFDVSVLLSSLATLVLGVALVFFSRRVGFAVLFRWLVPFTVVALVAMELPFGWTDFLCSLITDTSDSLVQVLIYLFVLTMAKRDIVPVALGVGIANGLVQLGVLGGNLLGRAVTGPAPLLPFDGVLPALICLVALAGILVPASEPASEGSGLPAGPDAIERSLLEACGRLQKHFGLSDRETEIAFLLAQGRSRPYIREKLFISKNTVATHIRHIYGKMDIHSREELIDLVTETTREG